MKNDTQIGQQQTGLTTQLKPPRDDGYYVCAKCGIRGDDPLISCLCVLYAEGTTPMNVRIPWKYQYQKQSEVTQGGMLASNGYPDNNPKTAFGAKKIPLETVPPIAIHALAEAFSDGAKKYGPYNWREKSISSSVYYGAALRHLTAWWDGEDVAEDSGIHHLHHALACITMVLDGKSVGMLNDNRPPTGASGQWQKNWLAKHKDVPGNVPKLNEMQGG